MYQNLLEAIINVTGFTPLESDMLEIIRAYEKDLEEQKKESEYIRPINFLKANEIEFEQLQMKSRLNGEFELCAEQWSLSVEGSDFKYSDNPHEDYRKLKAKFQKWINTWITNKKGSSQSKVQNILSVNEQVKKSFEE